MRFPIILTALLSAFITVFTGSLSGQSLYPVPEEEKISRATLIAEGRVVGRRSFFNETGRIIYTANQVELYKVFKGQAPGDTIEIITLGGVVGNRALHVSHLLTLEPEETGLFYCTEADRQALRLQSFSGRLYDVYSSAQGFLRYDREMRVASAPFVRYDNIETQLYPLLRQRVGRNPEIRRPAMRRAQLQQTLQESANQVLAPVITGFSPAMVHAGALPDTDNNVLTITGTGFGNPISGASVLFQHADQAVGNLHTVPFSSPLIISWTDTEIRLRVPDKAATGTFRVRTDVGLEASSPEPLQVKFSVLMADFGGTIGYRQYHLGNDNGMGGYDYKYSSSTANSGVDFSTSEARGTFDRAVNTWKAATGLNFRDAGSSTRQVVDAYDAENMVMFDNGGTGLPPLAAGVLATCFSGLEICGQNQAIKTGFDIVVRNNGFSTGTTQFTFGPCPPYSSPNSQVDLESVLLHELGHALNLGHIHDPLQGSGAGTANPAKVMHFAVSFNHRRISLDYSALEGARYLVNPTGRNFGNCFGASPEMTPGPISLPTNDECPLEFPVSTTPWNTIVPFDLANATSNKFVDPSYTQLTANGTGTTITNTAFYALRTNSAGGELTLEVRNYTTVPAEIGNCPVGFAGIPVTGVKLSLYTLNGCPGGGNFPSPLVHFSFDSNGMLPTVENLTPNTTYLLVADGIQNTKAKFDLVLSGTALIVRSTDLMGTIQGMSNLLSWTTDTTFNISSMALERSGDGISYEVLKEIISDQEQERGEYADLNPLPGNNYYRLAVENMDGTVEYSQVILIIRDAAVQQLKIYPNPATEHEVVVQIPVLIPGDYQMVVRSIQGMHIATRKYTLTAATNKLVLPVGGMRTGVYVLTVFGRDGRRIGSGKLIIP